MLGSAEALYNRSCSWLNFWGVLRLVWKVLIWLSATHIYRFSQCVSYKMLKRVHAQQKRPPQVNHMLIANGEPKKTQYISQCEVPLATHPLSKVEFQETSQLILMVT